jgi:hypothetical protein
MTVASSPKAKDSSSFGKLCWYQKEAPSVCCKSLFGARSDCKSRIYEPRNAAGQALASSFLTYLTRQMRQKKT